MWYVEDFNTRCIVCLLVLCFNYGHLDTVSKPNHTFPGAGLDSLYDLNYENELTHFCSLCDHS